MFKTCLVTVVYILRKKDREANSHISVAAGASLDQKQSWSTIQLQRPKHLNCPHCLPHSVYSRKLEAGARAGNQTQVLQCGTQSLDR